jgi:hypothetical protein
MYVHSSVLRRHMPLTDPRLAREARRELTKNGSANWIFQRSICGMPPSKLVFNPWICSCSASAITRLREQAFAESLIPFKLEKLSRYEVFLDRKLERMLAMLVRLKELRTTKAEA